MDAVLTSKEIAFRFKDLEYLDRTMFTSDECNSYEVWDLIQDERFLKMEYTQRKDVNGRKIFEGDILSPVKFHDTEVAVGEPLVVYYNPERLTFYWKKWSVNEAFWEYDLGSVKYKVIGNIHDNPELIQEVLS